MLRKLSRVDGCPTPFRREKAYARAGVDADLGNQLKCKIHGLVRQTQGLDVLGKIGGFGKLFAPNFSGMRQLDSQFEWGQPTETLA